MVPALAEPEPASQIPAALAVTAAIAAKAGRRHLPKSNPPPKSHPRTTTARTAGPPEERRKGRVPGIQAAHGAKQKLQTEGTALTSTDVDERTETFGSA